MKYGHLVFLFLFLAQGALANSFFIPNYYRNRRTVNSLSALGWSDRKEVGGSFAMDKSESDYATSNSLDSETDSKKFGPYVFYRTPVDLNIEAQYTLENASREFSSSPASNRDTKTGSGALGIGYEFKQIPIAFGLRYDRTNDETEASKYSSKYETKFESLSFGAGYRLDGGMYLGAGLAQSKYDYDSSLITDQKYTSFAVGGGYVIGDRKTPDAAFESMITFLNHNNSQRRTLSLQGLYNLDVWQFYGLASYGVTSGEADAKTYGLGAGMDWQISTFYLGPQITWSKYKEDEDSKFSWDFTGISIEAGLRIAELEAYLRYSPEKGKYEYPTSTASDREDTGREWEIGAAYKF